MADEDIVVLKAADSKDEEQEEIVSIEELTEEDEETEDVEEKPKEKKRFSKKIIFIALAVFILVLVLIVVLILVLNRKDENINVNTLANKIEKNYPMAKFEASNIDDMISRANELFERGDKFEALKIYENIATQSQSLSSYNLGVSQMKQGSCDEAVKSFDKAIRNKENTSVSAINAAICSLELKNAKNFYYYIELANSFLPDESASPLYSYYYALINYYKGNYVEALQALEHPSSNYYKNKHLYLSGKILSFLGRYDEAIEKLEKQKEFNADFTIAQLYARLANYTKARDYLQKAAKNTTNPDLINMTAALIDLKTGYYADASRFIKEVYDINSSIPAEIYRLKTTLNSELFDVNLAQMHFKNDMFFDKVRRYETLFYFAPYKVFDAKQTMKQIRKGGLSVFLDDTTKADEYLKNSQTISTINIELSLAIAKALNFELKEANAHFLKLVKIYPEHSILHYNLALTYAQLGNFSLSAKHFHTSYHLDPTNYLAGVFYVVSTDITGTLNPKFIKDLSENLELDPSIKGTNLYNSLLDLINENQASMMRFLEDNKDETTLNLALEIIAAKITNQHDIMKSKSERLTKLLPNDIVANILNFIANNEQEDVKKYAKSIQIYFKNLNLDEESFYNGASIIKKQYIKFLQISGLLFYERDKIKERLKDAPANVNLLQTLAYIEIFTNDFKESFDIYNRLIDEFKQEDAMTIFLASVAAIGAGQSQNAIALLELTRLSDPSAIENRTALGFLYHEIGNIEAAMIQYSRVGNTQFKNEFYDFKLIN